MSETVVRATIAAARAELARDDEISDETWAAVESASDELGESLPREHPWPTGRRAC